MTGEGSPSHDDGVVGDFASAHHDAVLDIS